MGEEFNARVGAAKILVSGLEYQVHWLQERIEHEKNVNKTHRKEVQMLKKHIIQVESGLKSEDSNNPPDIQFDRRVVCRKSNEEGDHSGSDNLDNLASGKRITTRKIIVLGNKGKCRGKGKHQQQEKTIGL